MIHLHHNFARKIDSYLFFSMEWFKFGQKSLNNYKPQKAQKKTKETQKSNSE